MFPLCYHPWVLGDKAVFQGRQRQHGKCVPARRPVRRGVFFARWEVEKERIEGAHLEKDLQKSVNVVTSISLTLGGRQKLFR